MRGDHSKQIVLKLISTDLLFTKFAATSLCDTFIAYNGTYFLLTVPQKVCWNRYRFQWEPTSYLTAVFSWKLSVSRISWYWDGVVLPGNPLLLARHFGCFSRHFNNCSRRDWSDQDTVKLCILNYSALEALEWISVDQNSDQIWTKFSGVWLRANHHKIYCSCRFCTKQYFLLIIHKTGSQGSGMQQLGKIGKIEDGSTRERLLIYIKHRRSLRYIRTLRHIGSSSLCPFFFYLILNMAML